MVELLVVIAVIVVLLALMLPALQFVRALGWQVTCSSNLHQIYVAWELYWEDYNGQFCRGRNRNYDFGGKVGTGTSRRRRPLNPYLQIPEVTDDDRVTQIFRCPSDQGGTDYDRESFNFFGNSYQANPLYIGPVPPLEWCPDEPWKSLFARINDSCYSIDRGAIKEPDSLLFVGDRNWCTQWDPLTPWDCGRAWHRKQHSYNMVFFGGHVELVWIRRGMFKTDDYRIYPLVSDSNYVTARQERVLSADEQQ